MPTIYKHVAILGATTGETTLGLPGDTRAFDVRTGKKLWDFHTVPLPGEVGHNTWLDNGWRGRSGVNVWAWYMTLDAERGLLYMPVAGPSGNYWGGDRPGNNLFANSIVAVDAETGRYRWHFQTVHHDLWDADMPNPPVLVDILQNGRRVPALASVGKTGYMFILDRVTGKPIFGVEERPVPKGNVPGEWYSPTQPFPVKPARPLSRVDFVKERDLVRPEDTSAQHVAECEALWEKSGGFANAGPYTPFGFHKEGEPPKSTIQFPGGTGGVNWGGAAADPTTGYVYVNAHDTSLVGWIEFKRPGQNYGNGTAGADAALRPRQRQRRRPLLQLQRALQGRHRPHARHPAVPASAVGAPGGRERQHRRDRLGDAARPHRGTAGRQAADRQQRQRRSHRHGGRTGVRRRHRRSPAACVRRQDRQGAVGRPPGRPGEREPDDLPRQERQAVCGGGRHRLAGRLRAALSELAAEPLANEMQHIGNQAFFVRCEEAMRRALVSISLLPAMPAAAGRAEASMGTILIGAVDDHQHPNDARSGRKSVNANACAGLPVWRSSQPASTHPETTRAPRR